MAEHKVQPSTMLLFIDPSGGDNYDTVVCLTNVSKSSSVNNIDAASWCGEKKVPGLLEMSYSFDGFHLQDPNGGTISGTSLLQLLRAKTKVGFRISPVTPVVGDEIEFGVCYITDLSSTYGFNTTGSFSGVLTPKGIPTVRSYTPPLGEPLVLGFDYSVWPVADPLSVSDWNTFFDLPTYGTPFTSVVLYSEDVVYLYGATDITIREDLFVNNSDISLLRDLSLCIKYVNDNAFRNCIYLRTLQMDSVLTMGFRSLAYINENCEFNYPVLNSIGDNCFEGCLASRTYTMPSLIHMGQDCDNNNVFLGIYDKIITLIIHSSLMTCNGGGPDVDIEYLDSLNDVTIVTD